MGGTMHLLTTGTAKKQKERESSEGARCHMAAEIDWEAVYARLPTETTAEDKARRRELFQQMSVHGGKRISIEEMQRGIVELLQLEGTIDVAPVVSRAVQSTRKLREKRGKEAAAAGVVDRCDFRALLVYLRQFLDYWRMFDAVDLNNDRQITEAEFELALPMLEKWGVQIDDPAAAFREVDENGGGLVLFAEFCDWAHEKSLAIDRQSSSDEDEGEEGAATNDAGAAEAMPPAEADEGAGADEQAAVEVEPGSAEEGQQAATTSSEGLGHEDVAPAVAAEAAPPVAPVAEPQPAAIVEAEVAQVDVVAEFDGHFFSQADVQDVVKLQSLYRRQDAQKRTRQRREALEARKRAEQSIPIEPITMPEVAGADESPGRGGPETKARSHGRLGNIDLSRITVNPMSADTKGMQTMYTRMLKSKMWW